MSPQVAQSAIGQLMSSSRPTFPRPIDDSKCFAGRVFDANEFEEWWQRVCDLKDDHNWLQHWRLWRVNCLESRDHVASTIVMLLTIM